MPFTTCLALSFLCLLGPALTLGEECEKRDDDTLAMIQRHKDHSARDIGRLKSCPCSGGPCFDSAPWHQLPGVRSMNQVQDHRLRSPAAQHDPLWISDQPDLGFHGGMMGSAKVPGWTALNSTPHMYMELHEGDNWQIAQAMNFATQHNLKLLIKNTGHDWFGRSMSRGFMLWTHNIQGSQWHDAFRPANCGHSEPAVSFAAGVQFWQVFQEMKEHKRLVVTGTCATVGHVGFTLGGGYGDYSHFYGSGASNLLEAEVILPSGQQVTASECNEYSDLFKALRGGGPGFGLVTKFTYRTYPEPAVSGMIMGTVSGDMVHNLAEFFAWYKALNEQKKVKHIGGILQLQPGHVIFVNLRFVNLPAEDCQALLQQSSFFNGLTCQQAAVFNDFSDYKSSENGSKGLQPDWLKSMASSHVGSHVMSNLGTWKHQRFVSA
ncbi:Uncharacterized FAD-linked oxidoreductase ARB_02478 [Durusdinium trenchii]|uniref:Uncharacterized FAD-linked oxidoreductase ARB_02478 n=1 Tax=Durusdinium trenchii TaxID=1381693 RepID=A0ABP0S9K8_9DINO